MRSTEEAALHIDLCKSTNSYDTVQVLLAFGHRHVRAESIEGVIRVLVEHHCKETDTSVRLKIASLLGLLSKTNGFSPDCIIDTVINIVNNEKSHQVLAQLLGTLLAIGSQLPDGPAVRQRLVEVACKHLSDTYFGVRKKALELLGCLGTVNRPPLTKGNKGLGTPAGMVKDIQSIISKYFGDDDPRVRTSAIKAMLQLNERGMKISQIIYEPACRSLSDDYEQVRSAAVQMVGVLSQLYPESIVPFSSSNEGIRLVDDSFGKISHMISDASWMVRVQAAKTLGSMLQVSPHFLELTLDKNLMSDLRKKRTDHEVVRELYTTGEFSLGRKWGVNKPKEKIDKNAVYLIDAGACGAFVHGLEDEMYEVRIAAVEALCLLARACPSFAEKCLDFLVDMFNDEIEEVRLQSIYALRQLSTHVTLREDQLDTVLAVLPDSSRHIREALHELLCYTNVFTKECIQLLLRELLKNLKKYPTDCNAVWKCLKLVGERHPTLVLHLVPELLETHPYLDTPEPDMDDPAYIGVLVLVFNAAKSCPTMPALFSNHTFKHYVYLRDSLSHLVPPLRLPGRKEVYGLDSADSGRGSGAVESTQLFLQQSLNRFSTIQNLMTLGAQDMLNFTIRDLQRLGELQPELAGAADFTATYLSCQLLLMKALHERLWNTSVPLILQQYISTVTSLIRQITEETYKLEFLYSGLERRQMAIIHHVRLQARALQLMLDARTGRGMDSLTRSCERFVQEVGSFQRSFHTELPHLQDSFVGMMLDLTPQLSSRGPVEQVQIVQTTLSHSRLLHPQLPPQIQRATAAAIVIEPTGKSDNPVRFIAGLVVALDIDATLEHIQDPLNTVKIQVLYPDGQSHVIQPKPVDFSKPGPNRHRLMSKVYLSMQSWTEPCQIEVCLLLAYSTGRLPTPEGAIEGTIALSKPVKVWIWPKPAKHLLEVNRPCQTQHYHTQNKMQ